MDPACYNLSEILPQIQDAAGDAPFLALGQTVFWDEPMKAGIVNLASRLGHKRRLVSGVHDTDYFAKLPGSTRRTGQFKSFPHNDTTTKGLWSAAAEFSTLFGSETVITRDLLASAGLRMAVLERARPGFLDEATEAWGWRGIVSLDEGSPIAGEVPLSALNESLEATFNWAVDTALQSLGGESRREAEARKAELDEKRAAARAESTHLYDYFKRLLPIFSEFVTGVPIQQEITATTELLKFNVSTCESPRFATLELFVDPETRPTAKASYDEAIKGGSGLYDLSRFGTGAIPFDLVIPGIGRGTIRLGTKAAVIMTPTPVFLTYKKPIKTICDLAELVEAKFGVNCTLVGKAVALIGMLAREFVFIFHEGASSYVKHSRKLHMLLNERCGLSLKFNPILRVRYKAWDSLSVACSWFQLPEPFRNAFGTEELCAPSFAGRWKEVAAEQEKLLAELGRLRRPVDLIGFLDNRLGGNWRGLAKEYGELQHQLEKLHSEVDVIRAERAHLYDERRNIRQRSQCLQTKAGDHFRAHIFEKESVSPEHDAQRKQHLADLEEVMHTQRLWKGKMADLRKRQQELVRDTRIVKIHDRRRAIELEAELKRLRLIRQAVISSKGLQRAAFRPSAWWFPLVCPDGLWYRETIESADYYLEPLQ